MVGLQELMIRLQVPITVIATGEEDSRTMNTIVGLKLRTALAYVVSAVASYYSHKFAIIFGLIMTFISISAMSGLWYAPVHLMSLGLRRLENTAVYRKGKKALDRVRSLASRVSPSLFIVEIKGILHAYLFRTTLVRDTDYPMMPYHYPPIMHRPGYIRNLKMWTTLLGTRLDMIQAPLENPHPYTAVSYNGRDPARNDVVNISGGKFSATKNVCGILRGLTPLLGTRYIWIDSICINQQDTKKKTQQFQLMR